MHSRSVSRSVDFGWNQTKGQGVKSFFDRLVRIVPIVDAFEGEGGGRIASLKVGGLRQRIRHEHGHASRLEEIKAGSIG